MDSAEPKRGLDVKQGHLLDQIPMWMWMFDIAAAANRSSSSCRTAAATAGRTDWACLQYKFHDIPSIFAPFHIGQLIYYYEKQPVTSLDLLPYIIVNWFHFNSSLHENNRLWSAFLPINCLRKKCESLPMSFESFLKAAIEVRSSKGLRNSWHTLLRTVVDVIFHCFSDTSCFVVSKTAY